MTRFLLTVLFITILYSSDSFAQIDSTLLTAIQTNNLEQVDSLISNTVVDIHATDEKGANALMWACHDADSAMVVLLFEKGATPPTNGWIYYEGQTILGTPVKGAYGNLQSVAAGEGKVGILKYLLDVQQLPVDEQAIHASNDSLSEWTALMHAAHQNKAESIKVLLFEHNANTNLKNKIGQTENVITNDIVLKKILDYTNEGLLDSLILFGKDNAHIEQLYTKSNYDLAFEKALKNLSFAKKNYGLRHLQSINLMSSISQIHQKKGNIKEAFIIGKEAYHLAIEVLGDKHPSCATSANNLALIHYTKGNLEEALALFEKAKEITKETLGINTKEYLKRISNLVAIYVKIGSYEKALPLALQALPLAQKILGTDNFDYIISLHNLSATYKYLGQLDKARPISEEVLRKTKEILGTEHDFYNVALNNLGSLYKDMEIYDKALVIAKESLDNTEKKLGKNHFRYLTRLNNLAGIYRKTKDYENSLLIFEECIERSKKMNRINHISYATLLNNTANLYRDIQQNTIADSLYLESINITQQILGIKHPHYITRLYNYGIFNDFINNPNTAYSTFLSLLESSINIITEQFYFVPTDAQSSWKKRYTRNNEVINSFFTKHDFPIPSSLELYNILLKGLVVNNTSQLNSNNGTKQFNEWLSLKKHIGKELSKPISKRTGQLDSLQNEANKLETFLLTENKVFRKLQTKIDIDAIRQKLHPNEAIIDFIHFDYYDVDRKTDTVYYVAYLIKPNSELIEQVKICTKKQLQQALQTPSVQHPADELYASRGLTPTDKSNLNQLSFIWEALLPKLEGVKTVHISPSGLLNKLNLGAIPIDQNSLAFDKFKIHQYTNFRSFLLDANEKTTIDMLLVGGVDYDSSPTLLENQDTTLHLLANTLSNPDEQPLRSEIGNKWKYLNNTSKEVNKIKKIAKKQKVEAILLEAKNASEALIKSELSKANSPYLVHFSTHGYFYPDITTNESSAFKGSANPLIRSGILLSGANYAWQNGTAPEGYTEDGILTAYEVANLNLNNTELVALSACETGLGDIQGSEGVFGLQRAFKIAGANYILMSLWKVSDKHTQELMGYFYKNWLQKKQSIPTAFTNAQQKMRRKHKNPQYWAGFILTR